ncbi:uncharacterized protein LOC119400883 [Rhipicephalus sanguineus]|uniref:uncharacterized protein LOC119400883 n=1 Tax=Rhipicephalus sanguineus TaxID=34632 RepID=UPI001895B904|nr:uncharacterized protein LOC119400883 [Rhipicephalus sanguineus]
MKLLATILLARLTWCADLDGYYNTGQANTGKISVVEGMLQTGIPLLLHWSEGMPKSLEKHRCLQVTYTAYSPDNTYSCSVTSGWVGDSSKQGKKPKAENIIVSVNLNQTGASAVLHVGTKSNSEIEELVKGTHDIVYAAHDCMILRTTTSTEQSMCTAWIPANTVTHLHARCRYEFITSCKSCAARTSGS